MELESAREIIRIIEEDRKLYTGALTMCRSNMAEEWVPVQVRNANKGNKSAFKIQNVGLTTSNRIAPLQLVQQRKKPEQRRRKTEERTLVEVRSECTNVTSKTKVSTTPKHKVVVIGDSHARGCASEINSNLRSKETCAYGVVKPGMCMENITKSATQEIKTMTKKDVVVIWGGTNDIGKDCTDNGQRHLESFVCNNNHTNVIVMSAPHRHDLPKMSCVNSEVVTYNRKLRKRMKIHDHVTVIDLNLERNNFTRHGLHLNHKGKEEAGKIISATIKELLYRKNHSIELQWKEEVGDIQQAADLPGAAVKQYKEIARPSEIEDLQQIIRASTRTRRIPQKLSKDFL